MDKMYFGRMFAVSRHIWMSEPTRWPRTLILLLVLLLLFLLLLFLLHIILSFS